MPAFICFATEFRVDVAEDNQVTRHLICFSDKLQGWFIKRVSLPGQCKKSQVLIGHRKFVNINSQMMKHATIFKTMGAAKDHLMYEVYDD